MTDQDMSEKELLAELTELRKRNLELEHSLAAVRQHGEAGQEAEAAAKAMVDAFDGLIYVCSPDYEIEFMNEGFIQRTGHNPTGEKCYQAIHDLKEVCPWCVKERVQKGETVRWEIQSPKDNRWYYVVNTPVRHRDGTISKMAVIQDVTQRKQAEEELRKAKDELEARVRERTSELESNVQRLEQEISIRKKTEAALLDSEKRYHSLFDNMLEGLAYCKMFFEDGAPQDFVYLAVNDSFERLTGLKNVVGKKVSEVIPGLRESNPELFEAYGRVSLTGNPETLETYVDSLGIWFSVSVYSTQTEHFVAVFGNVTERKRAEEQSQLAEEFLKTVLDSLPIAVFAKSAEDHRFILWNKASETLFGFTKEQVVGKTDYDFFPKEQAEFFWEKDRETFASGEIIDIPEEPILTGHLGNRVLHTRKVPVYDKERQPSCLLAISQDITERKHAEELLRQAEQRYRRLFEDAPLMFVITRNEQGAPLINDCNELFLSSVGYSREEVVGQPLEKFYSPQSRAELLEGGGFSRAMAGEFFIGERQLLARDGRLIPTLLYTATEADASGHVIGTRAMFVDIIERKQAEEALEKSEKRYRELVEKANDIIYLADASGHFLFFNPVGLRITGYSQEEIVRKHYLDLIHPAYRSQVERFYGLQFVKRIPDTYNEVPIITKRGESVWIGQSVQLVTEDDAIVGFQAICRDITDRKGAEEKLRRSEERLELALKGADLGLWDWDLRAAQPVWNSRAVEMLGYSLDEVEHSLPTFKSFIHPEDWPAVSDTLNGHLEGRLPSFQVECRFQCKSGDWKWILSQGKIVEYDAEGNPSRMTGTSLDITARKAAEQEREDLRAELLQAQKMEAIGTLAGGIAHDFNNLLTVVLGFSELLLIGKDERDPSYADLRKIHQAARSGAELVKSILAFSRRSEINPRPLNLNDEIKQVGNLLARTIPKMIDIALVLSNDLGTVNADPTQVEQILMNLAVNAKDAMPDEGKLTIETENVTLDEEYCRMHPGANPGRYALLSVSDTGHGMDEETAKHIFEPFYTTKETGQGTGLGLAMVYGIVQQHGGYITSDSEAGVGTTFKIYLPIVSRGAESKTPPEASMLSRGTETLLLVDDEEIVRDLGGRILERSGYTVLVAHNGKEALGIYAKERSKISLVILDLMMPEMGGKECFQKLLVIDPQVKVIIASGYTSGGALKEATALGARGFVGKPYDLKQLLGTVREVLDRS